jgi:hypothetical protein
MPAVCYPIQVIKGVPVVAAPEEIDITNADWLRSVLLHAADRGNGRFVVDLTRTQFVPRPGSVSSCGRTSGRWPKAASWGW